VPYKEAAELQRPVQLKTLSDRYQKTVPDTLPLVFANCSGLRENLEFHAAFTDNLL